MPSVNHSDVGAMARGHSLSLPNVYHVCGFLLALPIFVSVGPSGINLPENYYELSGMPVHLNIIALSFILMQVRYTKAFYIGIFAFLAYIALSAFQSFERPLYAIQSIYFLLFYYGIDALSAKQLNSVSRGATYSLFAFCLAHVVSMIVDSGASILGLFAEGGDFWGFSIYQSYLTYPLVLVLGLFLYEHQSNHQERWLNLFVVVVFIIEIILMRRIGLSILFLFCLLYRRNMALILALISLMLVLLLGLIGSSTLDNLLLASSMVFDRVFDGEFTRAMTWERSMEYLTDINTLLIGNGLNNHSHNLAMHTLTTHGVFYSLIIAILIGSRLAGFLSRVGYAFRPAVMLVGIVLVDWSLNVNLYQAYYAGMLALILVSVGKSARYNVYEQDSQ